MARRRRTSSVGPACNHVMRKSLRHRNIEHGSANVRQEKWPKRIVRCSSGHQENIENVSLEFCSLKKGIIVLRLERRNRRNALDYFTKRVPAFQSRVNEC